MRQLEVQRKNYGHAHERMEGALGVRAIARIENHHNFAWKMEDEQGREMIVHRKGATPAAKGELGIIPGSMTAPGFIVRGKGAREALQSASHGAGRVLSRRKARETIAKAAVKDELASAGVDLIGAAIDEAPMAYKNIHQVMAAQTDLVDILSIFYPKIVRMCDEQTIKIGKAVYSRLSVYKKRSRD